MQPLYVWHNRNVIYGGFYTPFAFRVALALPPGLFEIPRLTFSALVMQMRLSYLCPVNNYHFHSRSCCYYVPYIQLSLLLCIDNSYTICRPSNIWVNMGLLAILVISVSSLTPGSVCGHTIHIPLNKGQDLLTRYYTL